MKNWIMRNSNHIAFGCGIGTMLCGGVASVVAAVKITKKLDQMEDDKKPKGYKQWIKTFGKDIAIPATLVVVGTTTTTVSYRHQSKTAVAAGCLASASQAALADYKESVKDYFKKKHKDEKADKEIKEVDAINAQKKVDRVDIPSVKLRPGEDICFEAGFGIVISCSVENLRAAENELNYKLQRQDWVTLNEFLGLLNVEPIQVGWSIGWHIDDGLVDISVDGAIRDGKPVIVFDLTLTKLRVWGQYGEKMLLNA